MGLLPFVKDRVVLTFFENEVLFGLMEIDATLSAQHKLHAQVTRHPVARGQALTDNVRPDPDSLVLECFFGNRPGDIILMGKRYATADFDHAESAFEQLEDSFRKARKVSIKMRLKIYEDMVIEDIGVPETVADGGSVKATITFTQIKTASATILVKAKPKSTGAGPKQVGGGKPTSTATPAVKQSVGAKLLDNIGASKGSTLLKKPGG